MHTRLSKVREAGKVKRKIRRAIFQHRNEGAPPSAGSILSIAHCNAAEEEEEAASRYRPVA